MKNKNHLLPFHTDIILENDRVYISPLTTENREELYSYGVDEPELWTYSLLSGAGKDGISHYLNLALQAREEKSAYPFIIYDKQSKAYAGSTRYYDLSVVHNTLSIGYTWIGKAFQGTGLNKNCKYLLLKYAFEQVGVERVEFRADHKNKRSIAAMKSLGCVEEGILRQNCASLTGRRDSIVLSILKSEWFDTVKDRLLARI